MTSDIKQFFSSGPVVAFKWNINNSYFEFVSENFKQNYGYSTNEVIKNRLFLREVLPKKDLDRILTEIEKNNTEPKAFSVSPIKIKLADDSYSLIKFFFNSFNSSEKEMNFLFGYLTDISEEIDAKNKSIENKEIYRTIAESSTDIIFMIEQSGIVRYINKTVEEVQGLKQSEIINSSFKNFVPKNEIPRYLSKITKIYLGKEIRNFRTSVYDKNKNIIPVEINGKLANYKGTKVALGVIRDVRKQVRYEDELKKLTSAVEFSVNGILITDADGRIEYLNRKYSEISGYTYRDLIGKIFDVFINGKDSILKDIEEQIRAKGEWHSDFLKRRKNGKLFWEHLAIAPIFGKNKETVNYVIISEDITERVNAEKELIISKEKAEKSDRLKTAFLANISHEIRTPLNAIMGFASFLKNNDYEPDKRLKYSEIIYESGNHLLELINNIVDLSKIESGQADVVKTKINIKELFEELYALFKPNIKNEKIDFSYEILNGSDKKDFISDKVKLKQIFLNLISNALKFTKNGFVRFTCQYLPEKVLFIVEDTGIGIPEAFKNEIFDRFKQADKISQKYGGTGLGLSIVKETVNLLKGNMHMDSQINIGTKFYFEFSYN